MVNHQSRKRASRKRASRKRASRKRASRKIGSPAKGWKNASPKRGSQRRAIMSKCGAKCFLSPKNLKFPICGKNCVQDCRGIAAAKSRASQYKYTNIASRASALYNRKCK